MLQPGNKKLGAVSCFSILAGPTCPGRTEACAKHCYAAKGFFMMPNVVESQRQNWRETMEAGFADKMIQEIRQVDPEVLRLHVSGDFYNVPYVRKWIKIASACSNVKMYAYTRSWQLRRFMPAFTELAQLDNFQLWWSCDKDTHVKHNAPPELDGVRVAYMQCTPDEPVPDYVDLIFRVKRGTIQRFIGGALVCPAENGIKSKAHCDKCQICWRAQAVPNAHSLALAVA